VSSPLGAFRGIPRDEMGWLQTAGRPDPTQVFYRANLPRMGLDDIAAALTTQVMTSVPLWLNAGDVVTNLSFLSGATAANTPTNWWFALYSTAATPALLAQTADQTTGAWAADTWKTVALQTVQRIATPASTGRRS
jgi:alpha-D-ribose 1-methylphosphonate 5-triphosphate synthase subunit PhnH